ncbi:MAG: acyl-ACP--UDP-N-acetylglucosamine O-acyltransferase, partial [Burkholderiaceae bacterium]|nr:acyl-ACP--UDP-N-acetylglucosamine O-acyltransferase [Burkholderiaceae bacterium]
KRRGFEADTINLLRRAYKTLYKEGMTTVEAVSALASMVAEHPASAGAIGLLKDFVSNSQRGIIR